MELLELGADGLRGALALGTAATWPLPHAVDDGGVSVDVALDRPDEVPLETGAPELAVGVDVDAGLFLFL